MTPDTKPAAGIGGTADQLAMTTCPKCGSTAVAFVCSERGCPVNGGAAYSSASSEVPERAAGRHGLSESAGAMAGSASVADWVDDVIAATAGLHECRDRYSRGEASGDALRASRKRFDDTRRRSIARLSSAVAVADGEWLSIETAPVNVAILIHVPRAEHYGPGVYRAILVDMGTGRRWHTTGLGVGRDLDAEDRPDGWQPLPAPPISPSPE